MAEINTATGKPHLQQVDYIRAIASLAVALFHLGGKALPVLKFGWLGVQVFFVLSGFIICWAIPLTYTWRMSWRFIGKRLIRIEPPYIISIILAVAAHFFWLNNYKPDWHNLLFHLAYLNNFTGGSYLSPVYWTLGIEFQFYLLVALCFPIFKGKWGSYAVLAFCIVPIYVHLPGSNVVGMFPAFAIGILYYQYLKKISNVYQWLMFTALATVCGVLTIGWLPMGASLLALALLLLPLKSNSIVAFFSRISFSLYLTHDTIGASLVANMGMYLPKTVVYKGLEFTTGILVSIAFAYLFYLWVERPFLKLSKRISYTSA